MMPRQTHVLCEIGDRANLTDEAATTAAAELTKCLPLLKDVEFSICMSGFDDDPRPIWEIPEAAAHVRRFAKLTGLDDWKTGALFQYLAEDAVALMKMCDCFSPDFPVAVHIRKNQGD